jgi:YD repeat-containing protein
MKGPREADLEPTFGSDEIPTIPFDPKNEGRQVMRTTYSLNIRIRCIALLCWIGLFITGVGHAITYTYDDLSQLIKVEYDDGSKIEYTYDKAGNILLQMHTKGAAIPVITITATDPNASEMGQDSGTFTVSRTGGTETALAVSYTVSGTATPGADYTALPSTVTILAGNPSATLIVTPVDDTTVEGEETVVVTLSSSSSYAVGSPGSATVTIADNDSVLSTITLVSPNGGESWETGTEHAIQWSYTGDPGATVKIQLLKAGKTTKSIATSTSIGASGSGSFAWNIPTGLAPATDYKIKVSSSTQASRQDSSNKAFSIVDALPLTSGKSVNGSVQKGAWKYYKISAPASLAQFKVTLTNVTGDPDLYVKKNAKPELYVYDSASKQLGERPESITLANTGEAVWYIGVKGYQASNNYTIKADVSADKTVTLTSGKAVAASVALGDWKYYRISAPSDTTQLKVTLTKLSADVDLYLLKSKRPQQLEYDKISRKAGTLSETITIKNTGENVWHIGVYGRSKGNCTVKAVLSKLLTDDQPVEEETLDP